MWEHSLIFVVYLAMGVFMIWYNWPHNIIFYIKSTFHGDPENTIEYADSQNLFTLITQDGRDRQKKLSMLNVVVF